MKHPVYPLVIASLVLSACGGARKTSQASADRRLDQTGPSIEHPLLEDKAGKEERSASTGGVLEETASATQNQLKLLESFTEEWQGVPHRMGGMSKSGVDCSGFVILAYQAAFKHQFKGRRAEDIFAELQVVPLDEMQPGDLVFFKIHGRRIDHVGIYLGESQFAHAGSSTGVTISDLKLGYWQKRLFKAGRPQ